MRYRLGTHREIKGLHQRLESARPAPAQIIRVTLQLEQAYFLNIARFRMSCGPIVADSDATTFHTIIVLVVISGNELHLSVVAANVPFVTACLSVHIAPSFCEPMPTRTRT